MLYISDFLCDYQKNHAVIDRMEPVFSWKTVSDGKNLVQSTYRISVSLGKVLFWDSGVVSTQESLEIFYAGKPLLPDCVYMVHLTVTASNGETAEYQGEFLSGKIHRPWKGKWISSGLENNSELKLPPEIYEKTFSVKKGLIRAALYSTALGVYKADCNGTTVSEDVNAPGFTSYHNRVQYQIYELLPLLHEGENTLRVIVSSGWYRGRIVNIINNFGSRIAFNCELHLFYDDGTEEIIISDNSWKWTGDGPLRASEYYDGDIYDANREDESQWTWHAVRILPKYEVPKSIVYQNCPLMRRRELLTPVSEIVGSDGSFIWDFGQNFAGCICFETSLPKGTVLTFQHGEELEKNHTLYRGNLTNCKQEIIYTCKGGTETYNPYFTTMGFRYVSVTGITSHKQLRIWAHARYSDLDEIGSFSCSVPELNQLYSNLVWSHKSNFQDVPSDCPQRYERMGWTGDFSTFIRTAVQNLNTQTFARKWLADLLLDQRPSGAMPWVVPEPLFYRAAREGGPCGWGDAAVIIPYVTYLAYGDRELLKRQYASMKKWVEKERRDAAWDSEGDDKYIWSSGYHFGDWLLPLSDKQEYWYGSAKWLATAYYANSTNLLAKTARILGYEKDAKKYEALFSRIRKAFCRKFLRSDGTIDSEYQGVYICAIAFDLLPPKERAAVSQQLSEDIRRRGNCVGTGLLGIAYILDALCDTGRTDEAFNLLFNENMPGWLYMVKNGATTIWEIWNGKSTYDPIPDGTIGTLPSMNHFAFGAVGDWMYRYIGGIRLDEQNPGYKHFTVSPALCRRIDDATMGLNSPYGQISVAWRREDDQFTMELAVPFNTSATVHLPDGSVHETGSGEHQFTCKVDARYICD